MYLYSLVIPNYNITEYTLLECYKLSNLRITISGRWEYSTGQPNQSRKLESNCKSDECNNADKRRRKTK